MVTGCGGTRPILHAEAGIPRESVAIRLARAFKTDSGILFKAKLVRASRRSREIVEGRLTVQSRCLVRQPSFCELTLPKHSPAEQELAKASFAQLR